MTDKTAEFDLERIYNAPRALVYKVWTDPRYVRLWWGIEGSTALRCDMDAREGGAWRVDMRAPNGVVYPNGGIFLEVVEQHRLVYTNVADPGSPAWATTPPPGPLVHTVVFADHGIGQTQVRMNTRASSVADKDLLVSRGFANGVQQGMARLAQVLEQLAGTDV